MDSPNTTESDAPGASEAHAASSAPLTTTAGRLVGSALSAGKSAAGSARTAIRSHPTANKVYRTAVGVTGGATVAVGVALMPLPGPGTLIALGGLAVLGSEFEGAKKVNAKATALAKRAARKVAERRAATSGDPPTQTGDASH